MALHVPFMKASITDTEYLLMTSVAAANFAEVPKLPSGASWVAEQHVQDIAGPATGEASADEEVTPPQSPREGLQRILSSPRKGDIEAPPAAGAVAPTQPAPSGTSSQTKIRVVVSLGEVELELKRTVEGLPQPLPLARFTVDEFYVAYRNAEDGSMHVVTCVPKVEIRDMRPEVPVEQSLVISSGHKASFLMLEVKNALSDMTMSSLEAVIFLIHRSGRSGRLMASQHVFFFLGALQWGASPGMTAQTLGITLQKPLFVAELGFLLNVTQFVVPNFSFVKSTPLPFVSMDILLTDEPYKAERDIWLSPSVRLLADAPGTSTFEFDGCGHRLVLPSKEHLDELLPLVIIGASCTLHMRNVTIVHADTLPACLQLAAGARMIAQPNDGVKMVSGAEALKVLSPKGRGKRQGAEGFIMSPGQSGSQQLDGSPGASSEQAARSISITFDAVGAGLQLVQIDKPSSAELALRGRRSAGPSAALSRSASNHPSDLDLSASATAVSAAALRDGMAAAAAAAAAPRSVRVISATMDLSATLESKGLRQHGSVRVQGLRAETRTILDIAKVAEKMEKTSLAEHKKVRGRKEDEVLRPCSVFLEFDLLSAQVPGEEAPQVVRTDVTLETSEIRAMLSPGTLELGLSLSTTALAPLMQPGPDAALRASSQFERVWSFDPVAAEQKNAELAVSLAATGIGAGVTVWRPQTATGYGVTGHIITPGEDRPTFEVLTVAVNSGIAAYPASYSRVWSVDGATIWRPVAPEGYVAMGDVLVLGDEEPELSEVLCLHGKRYRFYSS